MKNLTPELLRNFATSFDTSDIIALIKFADQWENEQKELNICLNKLLHDPVGYVDPTTLIEFRYSNVISGRIYADGDHAYTPVFTKDQFDAAGILQRPYVQIE